MKELDVASEYTRIHAKRTRPREGCLDTLVPICHAFFTSKWQKCTTLLIII